MPKLNYLKSNADTEASPHYRTPRVLIGDTSILLPSSQSKLYLIIGIPVILISVFVVYQYQKINSR